MAKNPRPNKKNRHSLYLATTGYGKTTKMKRNQWMKHNRVIAWDPGHDHKTSTRTTTLRAAYTSLLEQANKGPISLAYSPPRARPAEFKVFADMVWQVLDGRKNTVLIVEEADRVQKSAGQAGEEWSTLISEGRKFGLIILAASQRSQSIDKTLFSQVQNLYVGCHGMQDAEHIARFIGVPAAEIHGLKVGQWWHKSLGPEPAKRDDFSL